MVARPFAIALVGIFVTLVARRLHAGEPGAEQKARCSASYEQAQTLRREERLAAERAEILVCKETCPPTLASDCSKWLGEVDALMPTFAPSARDPSGNAIEDAVISVDGRALEREGGKGRPSYRVSPGPHTIRFDRPGSEPVEVHVDLHSGERDHAVAVVLSPKTRAVAISPPASRTPSYVLFGGLVLDHGALYFVESTGGTISRVPADGSGAVTTLATGISSPVSLAIDATHVYLVAQGSNEILRYAR